MNQPLVETFLASEESDADRAELKALSALVWPPSVLSQIKFPVSKPAPCHEWPFARLARVFILRCEGRIAAAAHFSPRRIQTQQGPLDVLALGGVRTHPDFRLRGFGAAVVRAAFEYVDNGAFGASLFQTGVQGFYEKLGCRCVDNVFVNSLGEDPQGRPWWDKVVMIYPASFAWPEGKVDLLGGAW